MDSTPSGPFRVKEFNEFESSQKVGFFFPERPIFFHPCATISELPSNISTMVWRVVLFKYNFIFVHMSIFNIGICINILQTGINKNWNEKISFMHQQNIYTKERKKINMTEYVFRFLLHTIRQIIWGKTNLSLLDVFAKSFHIPTFFTLKISGLAHNLTKRRIN